MTGILSKLTMNFLQRQYCLDELIFHENSIHTKYKLGPYIARHTCGHRYRIKKGGKKELLSENIEELPASTCSICFKLKTTTSKPTDEIIDLIYQNEGTQLIDTDFLELKAQFYEWLYKHLDLN